MKASFDPAAFVRRIGQDLVRAFDDAREATTSELVGDAMEQPVRDRLEQILPRGIAVGSGCVIDTRGGTSRQWTLFSMRAICARCFVLTIALRPHIILLSAYLRSER